MELSVCITDDEHEAWRAVELARHRMLTLLSNYREVLPHAPGAPPLTTAAKTGLRTRAPGLGRVPCD